MKNLTISSIIFTVVFLISSCATTKKWESLNTGNLNLNMKENTLTIVYTKTPFEARFMDVAAAVINSSSLGFSEYVYSETGRWTDPAYIEKTTKHRKASSEFEKKLDSFDVLTYFVSSFDKMKDSLKYFNLVFNSDSVKSPKILAHILTNDRNKLDAYFIKEITNSGNKYISAFKFQYGIGARAGKEQYGLKKSYRPFVRIVGEIKDVNSNTIVWVNKIEVFSDVSYRGRNEAKEEFDFNLIKEFKVICGKLASYLVEDLNGKQYYFPEGLVDYSINDDIL
jgi:hypothetical protein